MLMTPSSETERCPDCRVVLPKLPDTAPTHRYIGASASCWAVFTALVNGGEPPMTPQPLNGLLVDAYAAQHPGRPSPQAIQSVIVHTLVLHGVFAHQIAAKQAQWIRLRALGDNGPAKINRYKWLDPPDFSGALTVVDVAAAADPTARSTVAADYVAEVWRRWFAKHGDTLENWFERFVLGH